MYSNLISTSISQEQINEIIAAIDRINAKLPTLVSLTNEELSSLPKVSYKNIDFIHEVLDFVDTYPDLVPPDIDVQEIRKDFHKDLKDVELAEEASKLEKKLSSKSK